MSVLWSQTAHHVLLSVHIFAAVFWLGWMVFMFALLLPVLARVAPDRAGDIQGALQTRIRRVVFWLVPVIAGTGLHNMAYHGLLEPSVLFGTELGHSMLLKLGAASILFAIYYLAPVLIRRARGDDSSRCHGTPDPLVQKISIALHACAFGSGVTAAYLGVGLF